MSPNISIKPLRSIEFFFEKELKDKVVSINDVCMWC
jgi:hypothetical protein